MNKKPVLALIDGHALAYRAYFGLPSTFTTSKGEATHAVYGFINILLSIWKEYQPEALIVAFDLGPTFRHQIYRNYKATREKMPDDLRKQMKRIEQLIRAFNIPIATREDYEADDVIGTLASQATARDVETLIVTGDRDMLQLVGPNIKVITSGRSFSDRVVYDQAAIQEQYGLSPAQLVDLKSLIGDNSDNIPGVAGIGEKTAIKFLQRYTSLEGVYACLDEISPPIRAKLETRRENAFLSRDLGKIVIDVPGVELDLDRARLADFNIVEVANLFAELEFNSLFQRIPGVPPDKSLKEIATAKPAGPMPPDGVYRTIDSPKELADLVARLKQSDRLAIDAETDSTDETRTNLIGLAITPSEREGFYLPLAHGQTQQQVTGQQMSLFDALSTGETISPQLDLATVRTMLAPVLADPAITKYMHNAKFDLTVLERHGIVVQPPIFDTMIGAWLGNNAPGARYGLKDLTREKLNIQMTEISELIGSGQKQITMAQVLVEKVTPYAAADVDMTLRLAGPVETMLHASDAAAWEIFQELELPLIYVLKDMELAGVKLDIEALRQMSIQVGRELTDLERKIGEAAGVNFNVNSTQQLSDVLFKRLKLSTTGLSTTKSGHYSTAAGVLESLAGEHPIINLILEQRTLAKLKSTYVDAMPALVDPKTGRLHTTYNQIGISTGRLSSSSPNLQNIPIRTERGREIRRAFVAEPGWRLISADYSQVELRILAHIAEDPALLSAFANDEDIHAATAANVLKIALAEVTSDQRRIAKTVNFGIIYGQTAYGLARSTGMSKEEAAAFIEAYFEKYPGVKHYIEETKRLAAAQGYVTTLRGRRRDFSNLGKLPQGPQRSAAERETINSPIQGSAADIMKQAMIDLHAAIRERKLRSRILLQVHDELVLEAPEDEVLEAAELTRKVMREAYPLKVPLKVDVETGANWLDMVKV